MKSHIVNLTFVDQTHPFGEEHEPDSEFRLYSIMDRLKFRAGLALETLPIAAVKQYEAGSPTLRLMTEIPLRPDAARRAGVNLLLWDCRGAAWTLGLLTLQAAAQQCRAWAGAIVRS